MSLKHEIFPTPIWGFQWGDTSFISIIKQHCLELQKRLPNRDKSNFLGWQSPDDMHTDITFSPLIDKILEVANSEILEEFSQYGSAPFSVESMWVNINSPGAFNMAHIHGAELSGVFYVDVPLPASDSGRLVLVDPRQRVNMSEKRVRGLNLPIDPAPGACILFPSWLEHYVEPNKTNSTRISISFNLK